MDIELSNLIKERYGKTTYLYEHIDKTYEVNTEKGCYTIEPVYHIGTLTGYTFITDEGKTDYNYNLKGDN